MVFFWLQNHALDEIIFRINIHYLTILTNQFKPLSYEEEFVKESLWHGKKS